MDRFGLVIQVELRIIPLQKHLKTVAVAPEIELGPFQVVVIVINICFSKILAFFSPGYVIKFGFYA
jgi:hypothetical protein